MFWKSKKMKKEQRHIHENELTIETQKHKDKTMCAINETTKVTQSFNELMTKNHITFRIYRATHAQGGKGGR